MHIYFRVVELLESFKVRRTIILSSYPPSTFDFHQQSEPSEEEQLVDMLKDWFMKQDEKLYTMLETYQNQLKSIQRQSKSIQRMTDQIRQLTENQSYIPQ